MRPSYSLNGHLVNIRLGVALAAAHQLLPTSLLATCFQFLPEMILPMMLGLTPYLSPILRCVQRSGCQRPRYLVDSHSLRISITSASVSLTFPLRSPPRRVSIFPVPRPACEHTSGCR